MKNVITLEMNEQKDAWQIGYAYIYMLKKVKEHLKPSFCLNTELRECLRFWIFDKTLWKAVPTYSLNCCIPLNFIFVLQRIQYAAHE